MSIVEQAIKKSRLAEQQKPSRRADDAERARGRAQQALAIDPELRLNAVKVPVNVAACREQRLLMANGGENDSSAVASYRMLRTRLLHRARTNQWSTIAVTSAGANDGKTLTALNLALSMSRDKGREIVLLDLDMRNPSVCRTLGVRPARAISEFLEQGTDAKDLFFSIGSDNLLIAGGDLPAENASELLSSPKFAELLQVVKQGLVDPIVLIDLPPLLLTDDALVVAPKVDALLVIASEGSTSRAELANALQLLSEFPIAGVVLNRAEEAPRGYAYGYYNDEGTSNKRT
jgi:protein-tyrosine kinase